MPPLRWAPALLVLLMVAAALAAADELFGLWLSAMDQRYASGVLAGVTVWGAALSMGLWLPVLMKGRVREGPELEAARASLGRVGEVADHVHLSVFRSARLAASTVCYGRGYRVLISDAMVRALSPSALDGVIAHELGHVEHRHPHKTAALLAILCAYKFAVGVPVVAVIVGLLGYLALMRQWEFAADATAGQRVGVQTLVDALAEYRERAEVGQESPWSEWFSGHPTTRRRLARLLTEFPG